MNGRGQALCVDRKSRDGADDGSCYLADTNLGGADLIDINLAEADPTTANLVGARLTEVYVTPEQLALAADVSEAMTDRR